MKPIAKAFAAIIIVLGTVTLLSAYVSWHCESALRFGIYLVLTLVGSGLKITLPTVRSTMSVNFFFVLVCIAQLTMGETVVIGAAGFLVQYFWRGKSKPRLLQVAFNLSTAEGTYHLHATIADNAGNTTLLTRTVIVDNTGPTGDITVANAVRGTVAQIGRAHV